MGLYLGGLIIGRIFASEIWGAYFLFLGGGGGWGGGGLLVEFYGNLSQRDQGKILEYPSSPKKALKI